MPRDPVRPTSHIASGPSTVGGGGGGDGGERGGGCDGGGGGIVEVDELLLYDAESGAY